MPNAQWQEPSSPPLRARMKCCRGRQAPCTSGGAPAGGAPEEREPPFRAGNAGATRYCTSAPEAKHHGKGGRRSQRHLRQHRQPVRTVPETRKSRTSNTGSASSPAAGRLRSLGGPEAKEHRRHLARYAGPVAPTCHPDRVPYHRARTSAGIAAVVLRLPLVESISPRIRHVQDRSAPDRIRGPRLASVVDPRDPFGVRPADRSPLRSGAPIPVAPFAGR